jgi:hypothetical protein
MQTWWDICHSVSGKKVRIRQEPHQQRWLQQDNTGRTKTFSPTWITFEAPHIDEASLMFALLAAMIGRWDGVPAAEMDWAAYPQFNIEPGTVHHLLLTEENLSHGTGNPEIKEEFSHDSP